MSKLSISVMSMVLLFTRVSYIGDDVVIIVFQLKIEEQKGGPRR